MLTILNKGGIVTKKAIALGTFDGLHKGHRAVLDAAKDCFLTVLSFDTPPKCQDGLLMSVSDKVNALKSYGADEIKLLNFDRVKDIEPIPFLDYIKKEFSPDLIVCGFNFRFGKDALGDTELIKKYAQNNFIDFVCVNKVCENGETVSSTKIRNLLNMGETEKANELLYNEFSFEGTVISGDKRGRTIGFPTVNILYPKDLAKLKLGVYGGKIIIDKKTYKCITNIGIRPTFLSDEILCESHILDFSDDIYGKTVRLIPEKFIREEKKFTSLNELKSAIRHDIENI